MGIFDKAKDALGDHPEIVEKAGDFVDDKTGDKFTSQVDMGENFVEGQLSDPNDPNVTETKVVE